MKMTYGGALVMPSNYAMMDEEEMMYLEGGDTMFVRDAAVVARCYRETARTAKAAASMVGASAIVLGLYIGGWFGTVIGSVVGVLGVSFFMGLSNVCSAAAAEASRYSGKIKVTERMVNLKFIITIKKAY